MSKDALDISIDKLIEFSSQKPIIFEKIYWPIRRFIKDIPYNIRKIKWFWQRGCRGYADSDVWEMGSYLCDVIIPMLKHLKEKHVGYPGNLTDKKWEDLLDEMTQGFEAAKRVWEDEYIDEIQPNWFKNNKKITKESMNKCVKEIHRDIKIFNKTMPTFTKYFFSLWD